MTILDAAIRECARVPRPTCISFSGGRTSGLMLWSFLRVYDGKLPDDVRVIFTNTGKERPETLDFVQECSERWSVPITWLEFRPGDERWAEVGHNSASRAGEPFAALIGQRNALPNPVARMCTEALKVRPMVRYCRDVLGWRAWSNAVGIRADEPRRMTRVRDCASRRARERYTQHAPLGEAGVDAFHVAEFWAGQPFDLRLPITEAGKTLGGNCDLCLAGETEVVTSNGIRPIRELAGTTPKLLVPAVSAGRMSEVGTFQAAPVRSFGRQRLWRIDVTAHGGSSKTIYATAEHRWFLQTSATRQHDIGTATQTQDLKTGDKLRSLFRQPIGNVRGGVSRLGVMRGFVFCDGTVCASDERPAKVRVFQGKDEVFLPLFEACAGPGAERINENGTRCWEFYGVPRSWKLCFPDLDEDRHYLIGWLSGWFAADGCVSDIGACTLHAADRTHLEFARSLCAVLGIHCAPIRSQTRDVTLPQGGCLAGHVIHTLNLRRSHLPREFFWLAHHRARIEAAFIKEVRQYGWTVKHVEPTDRVEEVYCATVDDVGAFGLADGLMTGNCFLKSKANIAATIKENPSSADWWIEQEERTLGVAAPQARKFRIDRPTYREMRDAVTAQADLFDDLTGLECACTD